MYQKELVQSPVIITNSVEFRRTQIYIRKLQNLRDQEYPPDHRIVVADSKRSGRSTLAGKIWSINYIDCICAPFLRSPFTLKVKQTQKAFRRCTIFVKCILIYQNDNSDIFITIQPFIVFTRENSLGLLRRVPCIQPHRNNAV